MLQQQPESCCSIQEDERGDVYYLNSRSQKGKPITNKRVTVFEEGLLGITKCRKPAKFAKEHMGLHKVVVYSVGELECACKGYYRGRICSHTLVVEHLQGKLNIFEELSALARNRKRGRKKRSAPALVREEVEDEAGDHKRKRR